jgi:hypothetical protein
MTESVVFETLPPGFFEEAIFAFDDLREYEDREEDDDDAPTGGSSSSNSSNRSRQQQQRRTFESGIYISDDAEREERANPSKPSLNTVGEAMKMLRNMFDNQIQKATENAVPFNIAIRGDTEARNAFYTLLPTQHQREFFLQTTRSRASWPRLKSLFGAPPYAFLTSRDESILNATGISRSRSHMAYEDSKIANYSQFGIGQLTDEHDREYRVVDPTVDENDILPSALASTHNTTRVQLIVRVQKRSKQERIRRMRDANLKKTISFPSPGEVIVLKETKNLLRLQNRSNESSRQNTLKVLQVKPRDMNSSTAAVLAVRS